MSDSLLAVEVTLPDGSIVRWLLEEADDGTTDSLTNAIESILGPPDSIIL